MGSPWKGSVSKFFCALVHVDCAVLYFFVFYLIKHINTEVLKRWLCTGAFLVHPLLISTSFPTPLNSFVLFGYTCAGQYGWQVCGGDGGEPKAAKLPSSGAASMHYHQSPGGKASGLYFPLLMLHCCRCFHFTVNGDQYEKSSKINIPLGIGIWRYKGRVNTTLSSLLNDCPCERMSCAF